MNALSWNVRGLNTENKMLSVFNTLMSHKSSIIALLETKLNNSSINRFMRRFPSHWSHYHNNDSGYKGKILLLVDTRIWTTNILCTSAQQITAVLTNLSGFVYTGTFVYASNFFSERELLWSELAVVANNTHMS